MSLARKDVRAKLDPDLHEALVEIARVDGVTTAEFIENLLVPLIRKRVHDAIALARLATDAGITGNVRQVVPDPLDRRGARS